MGIIQTISYDKSRCLFHISLDDAYFEQNNINRQHITCMHTTNQMYTIVIYILKYKCTWDEHFFNGNDKAHYFYIIVKNRR
jgi:hypothetical protein